MRILVCGAGVLGSLYAARLHDADHDVSILARGERLAAIREHGIVIRDEGTGLLATSLVPAIDHLGPDDAYDLVIVVVRRDEVAGVLPSLAANVATPTVLFMGNNAGGPDELVAALGRERVLLGFPSAGGTILDGVVHARVASRRTSPTMIGELDGQTTERAGEIATAFTSAGFRVSISCCIDAWLKTHAAIVVPIAGAIYAAGGDMGRLARTPDARILAVRAIRESFTALRLLDIPITPGAYRGIVAMPEGALTGVLARAFDTDAARLMLARHAMAARDEMTMLADELRQLAVRADVELPSLERLIAYADPTREPMEEGSRTLVVRHPRRAAVVGGATAVAGFGIGLVALRRARPDLAARLPMPRLPGAIVSAVHLPAIALPALTLPALTLPALTLPALTLPHVTVPSVTLATRTLPAIPARIARGRRPFGRSFAVGRSRILLRRLIVLRAFLAAIRPAMVRRSATP